jgi:hypothetical protein
MSAARPISVDPHSVRQVARGRAVSWLAEAYPELYRELYQQALDQDRVELAGRPARQAHQQASRRARAELRARFPEEYAARYQAELAAIQPIEPVATGVVDRHSAAVARVRTLVWLADLYPDDARRRLQAEQVRVPLDPVNRTPGRREALAWVWALEGLRTVYPEQFQARYSLELARQTDQAAQP